MVLVELFSYDVLATEMESANNAAYLVDGPVVPEYLRGRKLGEYGN